MLKSPLISIVLLNWNGKKHIFKALEALSKQKMLQFEVIVVDNGSTDGSIAEIQKLHPDHRYVLNSKNLGFACGMNQGITASNGKYVLALNQDVYLDPYFLEQAVETMEKNHTLGAVGGLIFIWDFPVLTEKLRREGGELFFKKWIQGTGKHSSTVVKTFGPPGSCPVFRKAMLEDIKFKSGYYFDPLFETGWEDIDLYFRMQLFGWQALSNPLIKAWHIGSGSVEGKDTFLTKNPDYQKRIIRNRWYFIIKNVPLTILVKISPWLLFFECSLPFYLLVKSPKTLPAYFKAISELIQNIPLLFGMRRQIKKFKIVNNAYIYSFFRK